MLYTDLELTSQRNTVNNILNNIYYHILNMYKNNDYEYVHIGKDVEGLDYVYICFGNIFFELYNKRYLNTTSFGGFNFVKDKNSNEMNYQISFAVLDDSMDLTDKKQILNTYIHLLTDCRLAILHELIHCNDADNGYITEGMTSNSNDKKEYVNNKMEYHAYLQELLALAEEDMILNKWNKMNMLQRLNLKNKYLENREKERNDKNLYIAYFTQEHYNEMVEHVENLFASHMLDR